MESTGTQQLRKRFPHWSNNDRDLWIDLLDSYSGVLLGALAGEETGADLREDLAESRIRTAARLADVAVEEMQYRFWIQKPVMRVARENRDSKPGRRPRPRARY